MRARVSANRRSRRCSGGCALPGARRRRRRAARRTSAGFRRYRGPTAFLTCATLFLLIRANLNFDSSAFRHALRLAVTVGFATALYRIAGLERGYWIALTALIVLRPEFQDTIGRGLARVGGTLAGAALATAIVWLFAPGHGAQVALLLAFIYGCYALFRINYAIFAACLTGYVVFLLMLGGVGELTAATTRAAYTMAGGTLALLAYAAWPTWAGRSAKAALAAMLDAHRAYVRDLLDSVRRSGALRPTHAQPACDRRRRLARSNAEAVIERMLDEPKSRRPLSRRRAVGLARRAAAPRARGARTPQRTRTTIGYAGSRARAAPRRNRRRPRGDRRGPARGPPAGTASATTSD